MRHNDWDPVTSDQNLTRREIFGLLGATSAIAAFKGVQYMTRLPSPEKLSNLERDITIAALEVYNSALNGYAEAVPDHLPAKGSSIRSGLGGLGRLTIMAAQSGQYENQAAEIDTSESRFATIRQSENIYSRWSWDATDRVRARFDEAINFDNFSEPLQEHIAHKIAMIFGVEMAIQTISDANYFATRGGSRERWIERAQIRPSVLADYYAGHIDKVEASDQIGRLKRGRTFHWNLFFNRYERDSLDSPILSLRGENNENNLQTLYGNALNRLSALTEEIGCNVESRYAHRVMAFMADHIINTEIDFIPSAAGEFSSDFSETLRGSMLSSALRDGPHTECGPIAQLVVR
ncbi:MAG: hypothetical protein AAF549_01315 [Pseudomonadota bacterium]